MTNKILIIEDNESYRKAAEDFFRDKDVEIVYAKDSDEAAASLESNPGYNGAIVDCFFPKKTGSEDRELGISMIEKMANEDPNFRKYDDVLEEFGKYVELDSELRTYIQSWAKSAQRYDLDKNPTLRAIARCSTVLGKAGAAHILKNTLGAMHKINSLDDKGSRDYYAALEKAVQEDERNQPLGIYIAETLEGIGVPFVLATSTYHHDILTQPICNYAGKRRWQVIDCYQGKEDEKATPEFWESVYSALNREMEDRR